MTDATTVKLYCDRVILGYIKKLPQDPTQLPSSLEIADDLTQGTPWRRGYNGEVYPYPFLRGPDSEFVRPGFQYTENSGFATAIARDRFEEEPAGGHTIIAQLRTGQGSIPRFLIIFRHNNFLPDPDSDITKKFYQGWIGVPRSWQALTSAKSEYLAQAISDQINSPEHYGQDRQALQALITNVVANDAEIKSVLHHSIKSNPLGLDLWRRNRWLRNIAVHSAKAEKMLPQDVIRQASQIELSWDMIPPYFAYTALKMLTDAERELLVGGSKTPNYLLEEIATSRKENCPPNKTLKKIPLCTQASGINWQQLAHAQVNGSSPKH